MLKNYIKVAIRNMQKHIFFTLINILGMTIGVTACLWTILYISDELSYDQFHTRADRMYTVALHGKIGDQEVRTLSTCPPLSAALKSEVPDVEDALRISHFYGPIVKYGEKSFAETKAFYVDENFFSFFTFPLLEGDPETALKEPNTIVLTKDLAKKYFGDDSAVGKLLIIGDTTAYRVTGVTANCPTNSHFIYNILVSASTNPDLRQDRWLNNNLHTYFLLKEGGSLENVSDSYDDLVVKYVGPEIEKFMKVDFESMKDEDNAYGYFSVKVTDLRLHASTLRHGLEPAGNMTYLYFFGAIGLFIIVIACINFMNLSTAQSAGRAKEVGLRKALGSYRSQMIGQFLAESMIYGFISIVLALVACYTLLPNFNFLAGKSLTMEAFVNPSFFLAIGLLVIFVGVVSGSYPAFYLTSFNTVEVFKGKIRSGMKSKGIRSILVGFQFSLSIFLIIFTSSIYLQLKYLQEKNLGFDKHQVLVIHNAYDLGTHKASFKNALEEQTQVATTSLVSNTFPGVNNTTIFRQAGSDQDHIMGVYFADYNHQDVFRFEMLEGRFFSRDYPSDSLAILLNEAAVREFGFEKPIGEYLDYPFDQVPVKLKIIGVFKDFNFESLKEEIRPLAIRFNNDGYSLMVRYSGNATEIIQLVESKWKTFTQDMPISYSFLDENFDSQFRAEERMSQVFSILSGLAIFVACLGLFALAAFTSEQRTKEIGIRKAMGASAINLVLLLTKEFTIIVLIAFAIGGLASWYVAEQWLTSFVYRIEISPLLYVFSGLAVLVLALLTVSFHSFRAASANPVKSLRYE